MEKINWLPLNGFVTINDDEIIHKPDQIIIDPQNNFPYYQKESYIRSNIFFENGEISFNVKLKDRTDRCQVVFECDSNDSLYVGINTGIYQFGIMNRINGYYQYLSSAASLANNFDDVNVRIKKTNAQLILFINEVKAAEAICPISKNIIGLYFCGNQDISVSKFICNPQKRNVFIVMQFTDEYNELYKEVIKPICEKHGYACIRADDVYTPTSILSDIINSITNASIIIAEITSKNPNVFYEVGYSHAIKKPSILLCDRNKVEKLPFDISGFRTLFYENTISGKTKIEENLSKYLENI